LIYKKSPEEIALMREGGRILTSALDRVQAAIAPGVTTAELDRVFADAIAERGAKASFLGYRGFPASICASLNDVIVHGIPDDTSLTDGDVISLDFGVLYEGFHTDSAWTFPVGEIDPAAAELLKVGEASLDAAIAQCHPGKRLGDVGHAVEEVAEGAGFSVVREYAGHGVGRALHEDPWIPNYGPSGRREVLSPGMTLAIEPMVNAGGEATKVLTDGWAVATADGSLSAHFEHTVAITPDGHEVLTARRPG
jgi:methionyl aminopeptidase